MTAMNPHDFREWMRKMERDLAEARRNNNRSAELTVQRAIEDLKNELPTGGAAGLIPARPRELTYQTGMYRDIAGGVKARLIVDFPDVVKSTDGQDIVVDSYEIVGTTTGSGNWYSAYPAQLTLGRSYPGMKGIVAIDDPNAMQTMGFSPTSGFRLEGLTAGNVLTIKVRAYSGRGLSPGQFSEEITLTLDIDKQPPAQPTAPEAIAGRGVIRVFWDGQSVNGSMPADFQYAILSHGTASSPTEEIYRFGRGGGIFIFADAEYYQPQFFRIQAFDESGNASVWSEQAVAYTSPLVDRDVILSTIDAAKTHLININAGVSILPNTIITEHLVVTEEMTAAIANFLYVKADKIDVNSLAADTAFVGLLDAKLVVSDMFQGKEFIGGRFVGPTFKTNVEEFRGVQWDATGIRAFSPRGEATVHIDANTGDFTAVGGTLTGLKYQTTTIPNRGVKIDSTGIYQWDDEGRVQLRMGGGVSNLLVGELRTSAPGLSGVQIINTNAYNWPGINFIRQGHLIAYGASLFGRFTVASPTVLPELVIKAPNELTVGGANQLGLVRIEGDLRLSLGDRAQYQLRAEQPFMITAQANNGAYHYLGIRAEIIDLDAQGGNINIDARSFYVQLPSTYHKTTGLPSNMVIAGDGGLFRSTSSVKYKDDVQEVELDPRLLDVRVVDWVDKFAQQEQERLMKEPRPLLKVESDRLDNIQMVELQRIPGAIAEEVDEAGGGQFVTRSPEGGIEALMYDRFTLARTELLKREMRSFRGEFDSLVEKLRGKKLI